jgi:hypothetical protein
LRLNGIEKEAVMKIRVQREDGAGEAIELSHDAWHVLRLGTINSLVAFVHRGWLLSQLAADAGAC